MAGSDRPDVVCAAHLWWDWVWQRPQQLPSRMAQRWPVRWVDEPRLQIGTAGDRFEVAEVRPGIRVARPGLPPRPPGLPPRTRRGVGANRRAGRRDRPDIREAGLGFASPLQARLEREVRAAVWPWRRGPPVRWLYTPAALPFLDPLRLDLVVYDVMDELRTFKYAPTGLAAQGLDLLMTA